MGKTYCTVHDVSFSNAICPWCGPEDVLDLKPEWAEAARGMEVGLVRLEPLVGGVRVISGGKETDMLDEEFAARILHGEDEKISCAGIFCGLVLFWAIFVVAFF